MSGKLKIIHVLQNPKPRKARGRNRIKGRRPMRRRPKGSAFSYVIRMIDGRHNVKWWTGRSWTARHAEAKRYNSAGRVVPAMKAAKRKAPADFIVLDAMPA